MDVVTLENYETRRQELVEANSNLLGVVLREKEQRLNAVLAGLKQECRDGCGGQVPFDIPVLTDERLTGSRLYRFCSMLPKGADLHVHDMAELPTEELVELLRKRDDFYIGPDFKLLASEKPEEVPAGYLPFRQALESGAVTRQELLENWTVLGAARQGVPVWEFFEGLFKKHAAISSHLEFARDYYRRAFRYYIEKGIYHVEIHMLMNDALEDCVDYLTMLREVYYQVRREEPGFFVRVIGAGLKADREDLSLTRKCFENTLTLQRQIKDCFDPARPSNFVIGFDLINEEDTNLPLRAFAPMLLNAREQYPEMQFYIHGGESLNAENDNLIDAYLLGVKRVGHGLNLYRYPDLLERYARSEICLEVCPISNQTLGYAADIRTHPAAEYLRRGVTIALASDDPAYQEHETLTDDFFAAALGWNLDVADLKQLGINSILYSGLDSGEKRQLLRLYRDKWNRFVDTALASF